MKIFNEKIIEISRCGLIKSSSKIVPEVEVLRGNHHMRIFWNQVYTSTNPRFLIWSIPVMGGHVDAHDGWVCASPGCNYCWIAVLKAPPLVFLLCFGSASCFSFLFRVIFLLNYCASLCRHVPPLVGFLRRCLSEKHVLTLCCRCCCFERYYYDLHRSYFVMDYLWWHPGKWARQCLSTLVEMIGTCLLYTSPSPRD